MDLQTLSPHRLVALQHRSRPQFMHDLGAGITVGIVALPLAMAFAIASDVRPEPSRRLHAA